MLNVSNDNPYLKNFDVYPQDNGKIVELISANEVVDLLYRKNKVPVWIDISVESIHNNCTVLHLLCAGRYSDDFKAIYYQKGETGPFGIKSPVFPPGYENDVSKFYLSRRNRFGR